MRQAAPESLGITLATLRRRARMSQRELSRHSEVSYTQISDIEKGTGGNPSPLTLRGLARGLATDNFAPNGYDTVRAGAFYRQLMESAGYLTGLPVESPQDGFVTEEDAENAVVRFLSSKAGDGNLAARLLQLARRYPDLSSDEQTVVRHLVGTWVKDD